MKHILIPTDFSNNALNAVVSTPHAGAASLISIDEILQEDAEKDMNAFLENIKNSKPHILIRESIKHGDLNSCIKSYLSKENIDFVCMGTKGESGIKGFFFGSNASHAVREINRPLFIVPNHKKFGGLNRVVMATDLDSLSFQGRKYDFLINLVSAFDSQFTLLHVQTSNHDVESKKYTNALKLSYELGEVDHNFQSINANSITEGIDQYAKANNADLVVLVARNRPAILELFHKSVTKAFAELSHFPLLIIPE